MKLHGVNRAKKPLRDSADTLLQVLRGIGTFHEQMPDSGNKEQKTGIPLRLHDKGRGTSKTNSEAAPENELRLLCLVVTVGDDR